MSNTLFRKVALDRLSSPEELDRLMKVTSVKGWIALAGIGVLLLMVIAWGVLGSIPTKLAGQCILVVRGGLNTVATLGSGRVSDLSVNVGDTVTRGQIIGRIEQPDLLHRIQIVEAQLRDAQTRYEHDVSYAREGFELQDANLQQQQQTLDSQLDVQRQKVQLLEDRRRVHARLLEQGLITHQTLINTEMELRGVQMDMENVHNQSKQLEVGRLEIEKQVASDLHRAQVQLDDARRAIDLVLSEARGAMQIISPYTGRVVEVQINEGQLVDRGFPVISVESTSIESNELEAFIYLPVSEGKKVRGGMIAEITPSTVRREEYGFLPAYVRAVSDYPASDQGLMRIFGNDKVVMQMSGGMAPLQIVAALTPSPDTPSHYQWSTRNGPPFALQSGTLCSASITVQAQRPISLVIPLLKKTLGLD